MRNKNNPIDDGIDSLMHFTEEDKQKMAERDAMTYLYHLLKTYYHEVGIEDNNDSKEEGTERGEENKI